MTETRTLTEIGSAIYDRISLPFRAPEVPEMLLYHAALLVDMEDLRYVELAWEERDDDLFGTLLVVRPGGSSASLASVARWPYLGATRAERTWSGPKPGRCRGSGHSA